jgi:hypothetical protein
MIISIAAAFIVAGIGSVGEAGYVKHGIKKADRGVKKGLSATSGGVKKGWHATESGVGKGASTASGGVKKGLHETGRFFKKVF